MVCWSVHLVKRFYAGVRRGYGLTFGALPFRNECTKRSGSRTFYCRVGWLWVVFECWCWCFESVESCGPAWPVFTGAPASLRAEKCRCLSFQSELIKIQPARISCYSVKREAYPPTGDIQDIRISKYSRGDHGASEIYYVGRRPGYQYIAAWGWTILPRSIMVFENGLWAISLLSLEGWLGFFSTWPRPFLIFDNAAKSALFRLYHENYEHA